MIARITQTILTIFIPQKSHTLPKNVHFFLQPVHCNILAYLYYHTLQYLLSTEFNVPPHFSCLVLTHEQYKFW